MASACLLHASLKWLHRFVTPDFDHIQDHSCHHPDTILIRGAYTGNSTAAQVWRLAPPCHRWVGTLLRSMRPSCSRMDTALRSRLRVYMCRPGVPASIIFLSMDGAVSDACVADRPHAQDLECCVG